MALAFGPAGAGAHKNGLFELACVLERAQVAASATRCLMTGRPEVLRAHFQQRQRVPDRADADPLGDWIASTAPACHPGRPIAGTARPWRAVQGHLHAARLDRLIQGHQTGLARLPLAWPTFKRAVDVFGALFARPIDGKGELLGMATGEPGPHQLPAGPWQSGLRDRRRWRAPLPRHTRQGLDAENPRAVGSRQHAGQRRLQRAGPHPAQAPAGGEHRQGHAPR